MQLTLSSKGQIVLPAPVRRRLRLRARSKLELEVRDGGEFLRPVGKTRPFEPIDYPAPGSLKLGPRDYALDKLAAFEAIDYPPAGTMKVNRRMRELDKLAGPYWCHVGVV